MVLELGTRRTPLERVLAPTLVVAALAASAAALHVAVGGQAIAGVGSDTAATVITRVLPGGGVWRSGIRVGYEIATLEPGEQEEDWLLIARHGERVIHAPKQAMTSELRDTAPSATLALVAAAVAVLLFPLSRRGAAALAVLALVLSQHPFLMAGDELPSALAAVWALAAPTAWLTVWPPTDRRPFPGAALAAVCLIILLWVLARVAATDIYDPVETVRISLAYALVVVIGLTVVREAWWTSGGYNLRDRVDLAALAAVIGGGVIALLLRVPLESITIMAMLFLATYPIVRGKVRQVVSWLLLGSVRERVAITAMEEERGRLARDLHDESLQAIAAVVRSMDEHPALASETATLRDVAAQLRNLTGALRPPILEDLGLCAAIPFLVEQAARATDADVECDVRADPSLEQPVRPPGDVELALLRIVQEALHNSTEHSAAEQIVVAGHLSSDEVELSVSDDGVGIDQETLQRAERVGRLGIHSMRQRAALIDAELRIEALDPGTRVSVRWRR